MFGRIIKKKKKLNYYFWLKVKLCVLNLFNISN